MAEQQRRQAPRQAPVMAAGATGTGGVTPVETVTNQTGVSEDIDNQVYFEEMSEGARG
ncbi:MAG TPA: hypothetical protein VD902_19240 [Symbiobacteriaceae bacterium]|nr:hypothetical protein [Symbiobacteriaceae bacterium]